MGTSVTPETESEQTISTPPENTDTTQTTTTPAPPQPDNNIELLRNTFTGALQEANQARIRAEQEAERLRNERNAPPAPDPERDVELLTTNPRKLISDIIAEQMRPLNEQSQQFAKQNLIGQAKQYLASNPNWKPLMDRPEFVQILDGILQNTQELNQNTVTAAYHMAVGLFVSQGGSIAPPTTTPTPTPQTTTHSQTVPTPPNIRSAPPITQPNQTKNKRRELTENEKLLARTVYKMSDDDYLDMIELPASAVATSTIGEAK